MSKTKHRVSKKDRFDDDAYEDAVIEKNKHDRRLDRVQKAKSLEDYLALQQRLENGE